MDQKPIITTIDDAHHWTVDNRYLFTGYRKNHLNFRDTLRSLFFMHNETCSIWTHLIGAIIFVFCLFFMFSSLSQSSVTYDNLKKKFKESDFLDSLSKHSQSISEGFKNLELKNNIDQLHTHLENLKSDYHAKYQIIKEKLIREEQVIVRNIHKKLEIIVHKIEEAFDRFKVNLSNFSNKLDSELNYNELLDKALNITPLVNFVDEIFHAQVEFYPVIVYIVTAITCMSLSAIFHSFFIINPKICKILQKCDYAGIVILIFGSSYALFYYNFYCYDFWKNLYLIILFVTSVVCFATSLSDFCDRAEGKTFLGLMMMSLALIGLVLPTLHNIVWSFYPHFAVNLIPAKEFALIGFTGLFYLGGLVFYITKFPERCYPKKFDIWFNSHAIFHLCVFFGAVAHFLLVLNVFKVRSCMSCSFN